MSLRHLAGAGRNTALVGTVVAGVALVWGVPARAQQDQPASAAPTTTLTPPSVTAPPVSSPVAAPSGVVPRWQFIPSISVTQGYTDNVRSVSTNRQSDFFTTISPGLTITGSGGRVSADAKYRLNYDRYYSANDLSAFRHDFVGNGRIELLEESLFVDANGTFSRQAISREDALSASERSVGRNQIDVLSYTLSPYYRSRFGGWAESEVRYSLSQVYFFDPSNAIENDPLRQSTNLSSDSTTHRLRGEVKSGSYFSRLLWKLSADASNTERTRGTFKSRTIDVETDYVLNRTVKLIVEAGYDSFEDPTLTNDLSAPFLLGGFELTPGPRTKLRFTGGERRNGFVASGDLNYKVTDRITFNAVYTDTIETQQSTIARNLDFLTRDPFGNFIDSRTGQVFTEGDLAQLRLTDTAFRQQQLLASLSGQYDVNSLALTFFRTVREPQGDTSPDASTLGTQTVYGVNLNYTRQLSPYLSAIVNASYSQSDTEGGDGRSDVIVRGSASLQYLFSENLSGLLTISHLNRDRKNDTTPIGSPSQGDLQESVITATLIKTF